MNGNTPYAGQSGVVDAGHVEQDLTGAQRDALRDSVTTIAARTREFLPDEYTVGSEVRQSGGGAEVRVAVQPPVGNPVTAGFRPEFDGDTADGIDADDRDEVARGLAASAALQVKQALDGHEGDAVAR